MSSKGTVNTFEKGMVLDFEPLATPKNVLTNCLNGTLNTFNGNENVLQTDIGNGRVETAELPAGYIPLGTTELGGIIYIVSYNPQLNRCLFGSFPSPERNFSSTESEFDLSFSISNTNFVLKSLIYCTGGEDQNDLPIKFQEVKSFIYKQKLSNNERTLSPGDKFIVFGNSMLSNIDKITHYEKSGDAGSLVLKYGNVDLKLATIDSNGRIVYLEDLLLRTINDNEEAKPTTKYLHAIANAKDEDNLEEYLNQLKNKFNIFTSKIAGELYVVGELELIDSMSVTWELKEATNTGGKIIVTCTYPSKNKAINLENIVVYNANNYLKPLLVLPCSDAKWSENTEDGTGEYEVSFDLTLNGNEPVTYRFIPLMSYGLVPLYSQIVTIDPSLFGQDILTGNVWKYYKNTDSMLLLFNLDYYLKEKEKATELNLYFIPYTELTNKTKEQIEENISNYTYIQVPKRKSYSGNFTLNISFESIEPDNLYLVAFLLKILNNKEIKNKYLYHCLYTNGVFNNKFLDNSIENFDKNLLSFDYYSDLSSEEPNISINADKDDKIVPSFINNEATLIKGNTKTNVSGDIHLDPKLKIQENYNTFNLNNFIMTVNSLGDTFVSKTFDKLNTTTKDFDEDFMDLEKAKVKSSELKDGEELTVSLNNKTIKIDGLFDNKICANTKTKKVTYNNYYRPLAFTKNDVLKYGLITNTTNNKFELNYSKFVGLGMSNGGKDNQGGGGLYHVKGTVLLINKNGKLAFTDNYTETNSGDGNSGISSFPNSEFDELVNKYYNSALIVPIMMVNAGTPYFNLDDNKGKERLLYFDDATLDSGNRRQRFLQEQQSTYKTFWLFVRQNNDTYIPLNQFIRILDTDLHMLRIQGEKTTDTTQLLNGLTYPQMLGSLLMQLYVKSTNEETSETNTVNNIMYYDNLINYIEINYNYSLKDGGYISFNDAKLSDLKTAFTNFINDINCLDYNLPESKAGNEKITIPIINKDLWLETYLQYLSDVVSIENGVYSPFGKNVTVSRNLLGTIFYIDNDELKRIDDNFKSFKLVDTISFDSNGHIQDASESNINSYISEGLSKFAQAIEYDRYSETSSLSQNKIVANIIQGIWGSLASADSWQKTTWKDIYLFNELRPNYGF